jgi:DNA-directed RNA polymerase specialized sigma24 family protein
MEYTQDFQSWQEALPLALALARKLARRQPLPLDVDSLVMEALWRAQVSGAVLSRQYVHVRITGAVRDEMRRVAEGQRHNYQDVGSFCDVDEQWGLRDESAVDVIEAIDRRRALEALPHAARHLVREALIVGKSQEEMADDFKVTRPAMSQVMTGLRAKPSSIVRLPGTVDLHAELRKAARVFLSRALDEAPSCTALAVRLETARTTAHRWVGPDRPLPKGIVVGTGGPLEEHLHGVGLRLVEKAFTRAGGSVDGAARLLGCSVMTARRWWRQLPQSAVDRRVRQDLSTATMIELRDEGFTAHEIGKRLGCTRSAVKWRLGARPRAPRRVVSTDSESVPTDSGENLGLRGIRL